jgi:hypothetical protein
MTFSEYKEQLKQKVQQMQEDRQKFSMITAMDLTALIADRLTNDGVDGNNNKFPDYSKFAIPTYYFNQQRTNRSGAYDSFKEKVKKGTVSSYENWRKHNGLPVDRRTHVFTGDMLKSLRPEIIEDSRTKTVVEIKSRKKDLQDRLNWNSSRMGVSLLLPTSDEADFVEQLNNDRFRKILEI